MYYGCKKEVEDKRDYKMKICTTSTFSFPEQYEIKMPKVKDQGIVNSCVAHSLSTFMEEYYLDENKTFSTGFIYGYRPLGYFQNEGMYPREAIKTLHKIGDVEEQYFSHNKELPEIKKLVDDKFEELKALACDYRIKSYARIYTITDIKKCLYNNIPVPVSIPVKNNLKVDSANIIKNEGPIDGYHMVILYGWNKDGFLLQNSWGKEWGKNGRAILPYDYEIDSAWAISTEDNNVETYETILQKIYRFISKIINFFKGR